MRPLRAALIAGLAAAACAGPEAEASDPAAAYLPLAVGRSWTYRCTTEGADPSIRTLRITGREAAAGEVRYRAELAGSGPPLRFSLFERPGQGVFSDESAPGEAPRPLLPADPRSGAAFDGWRLVAPHAVELPGGRTVQALRVENFDPEDPEVSVEQQLEWRARDYVKGVGMVQQADGMGGACVLTSRK